MNLRTFSALLLTTLLAPSILTAANEKPASEGRKPHPVTLIFYLTGANSPKDAEAIRASVGKVKSANVVELNAERGFVVVGLDSHAVSYHQVAQAIAEAGTVMAKKYDPRLKITVPEYAQGNNAAKVDHIFAGKRLNQRVKIEPVDKTKGQFIVHFVPLQLDPKDPAPQGFNGGHLNHPIHDPVPRGLGLTCIYASADGA